MVTNLDAVVKFTVVLESDIASVMAFLKNDGSPEAKTVGEKIIELARKEILAGFCR